MNILEQARDFVQVHGLEAEADWEREPLRSMNRWQVFERFKNLLAEEIEPANAAEWRAAVKELSDILKV